MAREYVRHVTKLNTYPPKPGDLISSLNTVHYVNLVLKVVQLSNTVYEIHSVRYAKYYDYKRTLLMNARVRTFKVNTASVHCRWSRVIELTEVERDNGADILAHLRSLPPENELYYMRPRHEQLPATQGA